jgi:(5-formylfuran-3-yl)methyl phosphate synthase
MTQLLISVKNAEEALLALDAGVDIIDLKDPDVGALGALGLAETAEIVRLIKSKTLVSATVGELHTSVSELLSDIQARTDIGVDVVKIVVSDLFQAADFYDEMSKLTKNSIKIIAVFFADESIDLALLPTLKSAGFFGAMLDTNNKHKNLLQVQQLHELRLFTQLCHQHQLSSGLAGSLKPQHVDTLLEINPTYIGFRGGVCDNSLRTNGLNHAKLTQLQNMLRNGNKININPHLILGLALHS